jgi:hypothetical protein
MTRLQPVGEDVRFAESFADLAEGGDAKDWIERLIAHHCNLAGRHRVCRTFLPWSLSSIVC